MLNENKHSLSGFGTQRLYHHASSLEVLTSSILNCKLMHVDSRPIVHVHLVWSMSKNYNWLNLRGGSAALEKESISTASYGEVNVSAQDQRPCWDHVQCSFTRITFTVSVITKRLTRATVMEAVFAVKLLEWTQFLSIISLKIHHHLAKHGRTISEDTPPPIAKHRRTISEAHACSTNQKL